jgi:Na+-transporting methylmalonyl-CoA/oxaloacetate decarboxylase gamma subunit
LYGLEAIQANNGWAISVVGVSIVFTGLVLLSLVISQLYKVLNLWENPGKLNVFKKKKIQESTPVNVQVLTAAQKESARQFKLLSSILEDDFSLPRLLKLAVTSGIENPYNSLSHLVKNQLIVPNGDGYYHWNQEMSEQSLEDK